jgi:hypothetical protein
MKSPIQLFLLSLLISSVLQNHSMNQRHGSSVGMTT